ncbi:MAG: tripartite tricarboxylate transporter substrate binding protein [Variovorax sp.]|nr:MAG: tripartite tricarboxylate transporter substrate binding protein [Variovorax sp.]
MNASQLLLRGLLVGCAAIGCAGAAAQAWPARPIKLIIPLAAGGATDKAARLLASRLGDALGQQVVPENVTGASGEIALKRLATSEPDGYTLGATANSLDTVAPHMSKLPYDAVNDFTWLGTYASFEYVLVTSASSPVKDLGALLAQARQSPGSISYGSSGVGTGNHLAGALLGDVAKAQFNSIPYRGGSPAMIDVVAGRTDFMFDVIGGAKTLIESGKVKALATTAKTRTSLLPEVPAVAEMLPGYEATGWFALIAPATLKPEIVRRLEAEIAKIQRDPAYRQQLEDMGYHAYASDPAELRKKISIESVKWQQVVERLPCSIRGTACEAGAAAPKTVQ